ncbi:LysR family transcriptional regulator [Finegoldia magna]|uniref:LysR family transcriptional regulator n=1 Tax=Finegoldia magna TaxID=1260 RepID=UPI002803DE62|nr:LysR family transcriptional regulator [Finegoldia magna]MDU1399717.1 LysR family transcriptional regulator [Finegoldia magna]
MDISKLESFLVLAECKSFTKTADLRYLSQPAISKHIDSLEQELGVYLFDRNGKTVSLTIQGRHFIKYAESIVKIYQKSQELIRQI